MRCSDVVMSNSEWQKYIKTKYLDLAHAMQKKGRPNPYEPDYFDNSVIVNDIKMANELIRACNEYIAEQLEMVEGMVC